jgi:hypothetical protein
MNNTELYEMINDTMSNWGEVATIAQLARDIASLEEDKAILYTDQEILKAWRDAANDFVDSAIGNEYDTPDSRLLENAAFDNDHRSVEEIREERISQWEVMRPRNKRIAEISKL